MFLHQKPINIQCCWHTREEAEKRKVRPSLRNPEQSADRHQRTVDPEGYILIDAWTHERSIASPRNAPPPKPARSMGKNDLWIAATAHASDAILPTTDIDFNHFDDV